VALVAGWIAFGFGVPLVKRDPPHLACTFVSLGHGCGTVLRTPSGATLLYDAGSLTSPARATNAISSYLWSQGIMHLDAVLLSHADADHFNAVPGLLERFSFGVVYVPPGMFDRDEPAVIALRDALERAKVSAREIYAGDRLAVGPPYQREQCRIEVLHPPRRGIIGSDNANSLVLAIEHQGKRVLLTGDLESRGLRDVLSEEPLHCDVLLAPHHGNRRSDPPGLAQWCTPSFVIISGSLNFNVAEATATYRAAGADVLHTAESGAITARVDDRGLSVANWLGPRQ
jgi:competence protein ComEC